MSNSDFFDWDREIQRSNHQAENTCQRIPVEMFAQDKIWVDAKKRITPIASLANGHIDNVVAWIKQHADHWTTTPVLVSPLMRALEAEVKSRVSKRNITPRQALKDVLMNDNIEYQTYVAPSRKIDNVTGAILAGLRTRGFDVVRIPK